MSITGPVGVVRVGDLQVTVTPLTMTEERALRRRLRKAADGAAGDGFTRCEKELAAMQKVPGAYLEAVRTITTLAFNRAGASDEQFFEFRDSPAGVALELFARGHKATPGLTLEGLTAVVTVENVDDVLDQLQKVLAGPFEPTP